MARLFISHSSLNNDKAIEVRDWLAANGWTDVFLDHDPERGIVAGQRWKEALQKAAYRCELVLALVSKEWPASGWCKSEIDAARLMGKKVIAALIGVDKGAVPLDLTDEQFIDLSGDPQAYRRLKEGLKRSGLDPTTFPFDADRPPYPGFAYLEEKDAAVFFGRDAQIVRGLDEIRRLARAGVTRMLVVLGASGSGKSSFLRAGLWPRLKRDDLAWLPLPIVRPERAAISGKYGVGQALQQAMSEPRFMEGVRQRGLPRSSLEIQDFIEKTEGGLAQLFGALRDIAQKGAADANAVPPTILLAIDQGEELFNEEGRNEARRFIDILTKTLAADPRVLAILVMRSDAFPLVQNEPALAALPKDTFTLDMMLEGSYRAVIEGPARLLDPPLLVDPKLVDALLEDISGQDALPLLAFTLRHLYDNTRVDNALTLTGYDKIGRVKGVIAQTVEQAYAEAVARGEAPKDREERLRLARLAFIPHLAQVNPVGQFVRRVSPRDKIPPEARPLIDRFAEQRLLIRDRRQDAEVIEVAHEALLRQPPFSDWLAEDREFLQWRDRVTQARTAFEADERGLLSGRELAIARSYMQTRAEREFEPADLKFIRDSVAADDKQRAEEAEEQRRREVAEKEEQERRLRDAERIAEEQKKAAVAGRRTAQVAFAGLAVAILVAGLAVWQYFTADQAKKEAVAQREVAVQAKEAADRARTNALEGQVKALTGAAEAQLASNQKFDDLNAVINSLEAVRKLQQISSPSPALQSLVARTLQSVLYGVTERDRIEKNKGQLISGVGSDGRQLPNLEDYGFVCFWNNLACLWDRSGEQMDKFLGSPNEDLRSATFSPDRSRLLTVSLIPSSDGAEDQNSPLTLRLWDLKTNKALAELKGRRGMVWSTSFSPDGSQIAIAGDDGIRLWDQNGHPVPGFKGGQGRTISVAFSPDGSQIGAVFSTRTFDFQTKQYKGDANVSLWNMLGGKIAQLKSDAAGE